MGNFKGRNARRPVLSVRDSAGNTKLAESDNGSTGLARSSIAVLVRKVYLLHGDALLTRCLIAIEAALHFNSERIHWNRLRRGGHCLDADVLEGSL
jgi:hypothetical protein